jgi:hypothetical protein
MGKFVIQENAVGKNLVGNNAQPIKIEFEVSKKSMPVAPWSFGIQQRTARTDYPGSQVPTEQILGWNFTPFTLSGRLDDRYNSPGYAMETQRLIELLVQRGNPTTFSWAADGAGEILTIDGIAVEANFDVRRQWDIGYSITVSPHIRSKETTIIALPFEQPKSASQYQKDLQEKLAQLQSLSETAAELDTTLLTKGRRFADVVDQLKDLKRGIEEIVFAIQIGGTGSVPELALTVLNVSNRFFDVAKVGANLSDLLKDANSNDDLMYITNAAKAMDYDFWAKETAFVARSMIFFGIDNATTLKKQAEPDAKRLYRPKAGESLYGISNRFYGNPHSWNVIAERNKLSDFILTGDELLVIPDVARR